VLWLNIQLTAKEFLIPRSPPS